MTDLNELWQGYNEQGEPQGSITLAQAKDGALHGAAHVWMWHHDGNQIRVLLQVRAVNSATWPGCLDVSAAGHIDFVESPLRAAVRETNEEIGANIGDSQLHLLFVHRQKLLAPPSNIIENEFQWVYGLQLDPAKHFRIIDGEVESVRWLSLNELKTLASQSSQESNLVPHGPIYFAELFRAIDRLRLQ